MATLSRAAGVGRNTFYEHFADVNAVLREARSAALGGVVRELERAEAAARTPIEKLRAVARAWVTSVAAGGEMLRASLDASGAQGAAADAPLHRVLTRIAAEARSAGATSAAPESLRVWAAVGAFEIVARRLGADADVALASRTLADLAVRMFR